MHFELLIKGETPAELSSILATLNTGANAITATAQPVKTAKTVTTAATAPPAETEETTDTDAPTTEAVRLAVKEKTTADPKKRDAVKKLLAEFDAASVTVLESKHYAAFLEKLKAL